MLVFNGSIRLTKKPMKPLTKTNEILSGLNSILVSQDEIHLMLGTLVTMHWYPTGSTPIVGSVPGHSGILLSGFLNLYHPLLFQTEKSLFPKTSLLNVILNNGIYHLIKGF